MSLNVIILQNEEDVVVNFRPFKNKVFGGISEVSFYPEIYYIDINLQCKIIVNLDLLTDTIGINTLKKLNINGF